MIKVETLVKNYGQTPAVDGITFHVKKGEILGLLGPNGAGKTTTMNMLTGYLSPTSGDIWIAGANVKTDTSKARKAIGYLPEQAPLYLDMTVYEFLSFVYDLKSASQTKKQHIDDICGQTGLAGKQRRLIRNLSKGNRQRVGLAQALVGDPDILILDEPTSGLDPAQITEIRNLIKAMRGKKTVILSSHILSEIENVCERVLIIGGGKILADGGLNELSSRVGRKHSAHIEGKPDLILQTIRAVPGVKSAALRARLDERTNDYAIEAEENADFRGAMFFALAEIRCPLVLLQRSNDGLESVFLAATQRKDGV